MARKTKSSRRSAQGADQKIAQAVVDSAQKIWLAGLGAFSRARSERDKMFETLVKRGQELRGQATRAADEALKTVRAQADATAQQAAGKWDKLEQVFEERVSRSLNRLGVLTNKDVDDLGRQVAELNEAVRDLMGDKAKTRKAKARKAPARKAAAPRKAKARKAPVRKSKAKAKAKAKAA